MRALIEEGNCKPYGIGLDDTSEDLKAKCVMCRLVVVALDKIGAFHSLTTRSNSLESKRRDSTTQPRGDFYSGCREHK